MTTTPPRLRLTAAVDDNNTPTLYRDGRVVAVRRDTPADPQHLAAPPALDPDVYDLLANVADPGEAVVERITDALIANRPQLAGQFVLPEPTRERYRHDARAVLAALLEVTRG